mgnify:FL=1
MEIIIIWAIFIIIVIMNMNKAKKMQQERMQEHQRNMQDHNQNAQQAQDVYPVNGPLKQGTLSHGANLNREQQTYSGSQKMTSAEAERLKQEIRSRNNFNGKNVASHRAEAPVPQYVTPPPAADNAAPAMKTLDKAEFHSPVMQAGSTGTYSDMTGGHTFTQYDCGHEYNDEIVPQSQTASKGILNDLKFDKNEMRKAFVMQEILKRKVI